MPQISFDDWGTLDTRIQISNLLTDMENLVKSLTIFKEEYQSREEAQNQVLEEAQKRDQAATAQITQLEAAQQKHEQMLDTAKAESAELKKHIQKLETKLAAALTPPKGDLYPAQLTKAQCEAGQAALLHTFRQRTDPARLCVHALQGRHLNRIVADDTDLCDVVFQLLDEAEARGQLPQMLTAAGHLNPSNPNCEPGWLRWHSSQARSPVSCP